MQLKHRRGFSLVEMAVVLLIVSLLIGGLTMTLSAQVDQRNIDETRRRLEAAREALIGYAIVNRRLPCPAIAASTGDEAPAGGGTCTTWYGGFLPARTIGFQPTDAAGYGLDAWGNRIRYALASLITGCTGSSTTPHFTSMTNLKANGVSCRPNDLDVCASAAGNTATSCNTAVRAVSTQTAAFILFSTGKNGALTPAAGSDEEQNINGDPVFVSRAPGDPAAAGSYDDVVLIVPAGVFYSRLVSAGILP